MTIIVDTLSFCHQDGFYGFILGLMQYIPIILFFGSFFWFLVQRDYLFLYLILTLKYSWILCLILKYLILSYIIEDESTNQLCGQFFPSLNRYVIYVIYKIFYPQTNFDPNNWGKGSIYPNIDLTQTFVYLSYLYTFVILSKPKNIHWFVILTWFFFPFIPLNNLLIRVDTIGSTFFSIGLGSILGILFYRLFFFTGLRFIKQEITKKKVSILSKLILCHCSSNNDHDENDIIFNTSFIHQLKSSYMYRDIQI